MRRPLIWTISGCLGIGSLLAMISCRLFGSEHFIRTRIGSTVFLVLSYVWAGTLFLLVPLYVLLDRKRVREVRKRVTEGQVNPKRLPIIPRFVFHAKYGSLPRWLYLPFVITACILGAFTILALLALFVLYVLVKFFPAH